MASKKMTWNDAIEHVLRQVGHPMNYLEITEEILKLGLRDDPGATPSYTVSAQFSMDKRKESKSRFVWVSSGVYGLREWQDLGSEPSPVESQETNDQNQIPISVQAYGIYWDRDGVNWRKNTPQLLGQQFESSADVDFCEQRGVYILFDHRSIVYVGRATATSLGVRLRDHTVDRLRTRWNRFSWFGFYGVSTSGKLMKPTEELTSFDNLISILEAVLIELNEPPQNRQQGKGLTGIEYLQKPDPSIAKRQILDAVNKALTYNES